MIFHHTAQLRGADAKLLNEQNTTVYPQFLCLDVVAAALLNELYNLSEMKYGNFE